ncbi:MAG TPA: multicopper oxidase domain-containing protein [Nitrospiraceae bacterium]|nr:multicopper oxidase domain-containing protein [Nitrospiraceae bacterium]
MLLRRSGAAFVAVVVGLLNWMGEAPAAHAETVHVIVSAKVATVQVAKDDEREAWTFDGTMPGPVIRVKEGDTVEFTLKNEADRVHSIDFHAAKTPWDKHFQGIASGTEASFTWKAEHPGIFFYHCGTDPMIQHVANGMYGAVIVEPKQPLAAADREYVIVQSEIYPSPFDVDAMFTGKPKHVVFNGRANRYLDEPLEARPGELIRLYVVNAGPNHFSAFHVIGAVFDRVYPSGNPKTSSTGFKRIPCRRAAPPSTI